MNAQIHPAEQPLIAYGDYQVVPDLAVAGEAPRYRAQKVHGEEIVCVLGLFDNTVATILAIEEHMSLCAASDLASFQLKFRAGAL